MAQKRTLRIRQTQKYEAPDWWKWAVWVDGSDEDLDGIARVEYTLHPTFPNPVRTVATRRNKFKLSTEGWGVFPLYARVHRKDGRVLRLKHNLVLRYPEGRKNLK